MRGAQDRGARGQHCLGDFQNESQGWEVCSSFLLPVRGWRHEAGRREGNMQVNITGRTHEKCLYMDVSMGAQVFHLLLSEVSWYCRPVQQKRVNDLRPEHVVSPTLSRCLELLTKWFCRQKNTSCSCFYRSRKKWIILWHLKLVAFFFGISFKNNHLNSDILETLTWFHLKPLKDRLVY